MTEWIITSSVLIVCVLALRFLLKNRISGRLRYGLWLLVLIRLLVPFSFPSSISVMNFLPEKPADSLTLGYVDYTLPDLAVKEPNPGLPQDLWQATYNENLQKYEQQIQQAKEETGTPVTLAQVLMGVWVIGMAITACVLVFSNCHFALKLRKNRKKLDCSDSPVAVYITDRIQTPCLFGLFRPAIYLTPELTDPQALRHVLFHELTHRRHWDHIWSALRCVCLVLHWYNPLVWVATVLSKQDAEVACDEAVIRHLGEDHRTAYGETLIGMTCTGQNSKVLLVAATTMVSSKKALKERILRIAKHPKTALYALIAIVLTALIVVGCTFTGAEPSTEPPAISPTEPQKEDNIHVTDVYEASLYIYEGEGFGSPFFIRLHPNGTFAYSAGSLSSYYGNGTWRISNDILTLTDDTMLGGSYVNHFRMEDNALVWQKKNSTGVMYLTLQDGDRFILADEKKPNSSSESYNSVLNDPMVGGVVNMDGVGYQYVERLEGPIPEGFTYQGTIYRDVCGVPSGDYAASVIIGGCRLYTSAKDPDTAYVCSPEGYGAEFILKMVRMGGNPRLPTALSEDELAQLQTELSWGGYLRCLNVPFYDLQQLDLYRLISFGSIPGSTPTKKAELEYIASQYTALAQDISPSEVLRIPVDDLNAFLKQYYGIALNYFSTESMMRNSLCNYLEETDSYYFPTSNAQPQSITVTSGICYGEKLYVRYLCQGRSYVASLWDVDGRYVFSNILPEG